MEKKSLVFLTIAVVIVLVASVVSVAISSFYFPSPNSPSQNMAEKQEGILQLKPGQRDNFLDAQIISINPDKKLIPVIVMLDIKFLNPPYLSIEKSLFLKENTKIYAGKLGEEKKEPVDISELKAGDNIIVATKNSVTDILEREIDDALWIKKVILPPE